MSNRSIVVGSRTLPISKADEQRFWAKVDKGGSGGCWIWTAGRHSTGYGKFHLGGRSGHKVPAHRFAYTLAGNDINPALMLDHLCHVRACVNPSHLRQATSAENGANRAGADFDSTSGIRGVFWDRQYGRWQAKAELHGHRYFAGRHASIEAAELAVIQLRVRLGMANAADLARLTELV